MSTFQFIFIVMCICCLALLMGVTESRELIHRQTSPTKTEATATLDTMLSNSQVQVDLQKQTIVMLIEQRQLLLDLYEAKVLGDVR